MRTSVIGAPWRGDSATARSTSVAGIVTKPSGTQERFVGAQEQQRDVRAVPGCGVDQPLDQHLCVTAVAVLRVGEHGADSTDARGLLIEHAGQVVLQGAGEQVGARYHRKSSPVTNRPVGPDLSSLEPRDGRAIETVVADETAPVEYPFENRTFGVR